MNVASVRPTARKIPHLRWWIAGLLFLASILNYIDRQALSLLAPTIQADLGLSDTQYGHVVSLFLVAYTIAYLVAGRVVETLGTRASLALFVGWWSVANMLTGFAKSVVSLGAFRFLLGLGEAGGYVASPKVVSQWFPPKDRGIAVGIYSVGSAVGATLAPLLVLALSDRFGWRGAFVATGALGLGFVAIWLTLFRLPHEHPRLGADERALIEQDCATAEAIEPAIPEGTRWKTVLGSPAVWALMLARLLTDPVWYFFQFWMPKYLHSARGFEQRELAHLWLIYLAADVGFLGGGFLSAHLIKGGADARAARLRTMAVCAVLVPLASLIAFAPGSGSVFAFAMLAVLAHTAWLTNLSTYIVDLVPKSILATAFGLIAAGSAAGGILMNEAVAWTVTRFSYDYCFYAMVALHPLAFAILWRFARRT